MQRQLNAYQQSHILTATPGDILLALYDGAIRFVGLAKGAIEEGNIARKAQAINRANAILGELTGTLDRARGPEVSAQLAALYGYFIERLHAASFRMESEPAEEVLQHLVRLRETWQQAVMRARAEGHRV